MRIIVVAVMLLLLWMLFSRVGQVEGFEIPLINPYSLYLHDDITRRERLWNRCHSKKLYYYANVEPQRFKE